MDFIKKMEDIQCRSGEVMIMWLGQAGFLLKNSQNKILAVDVYLSDLAMKQDGNKRLVPPIMSSKELKPDVILATHSHTDHLDLDSLPDMLREETELYCPVSSLELCRKRSLPMERIREVKPGDSFRKQGYEIKTVFADHGDTAPDAVGFIIRAENVSIYFTGDTGYQQDRMRQAVNQDIDVLLAPINGEYGNMNETDAAMLAAQIDAKLTIPCHFWTFARHEGSPFRFEMAMKMLAPKNEAYVMAIGESIKYRQNGEWQPVS